MSDVVKTATAATTPGLLERLRRDPGAHAWALQDLQCWPEKTTLLYTEGVAGLNYVLFTGHPGAQHGARTIVLGGAADGIAPLLSSLPPAPWLVRETPATLLPALKRVAPDAKVFPEARMEATRASFKPRHTGKARRLVAADAPALAAFSGAPPQAVGRFVPWIQGAMLLGVWDAAGLAAIASTFCRTPEVWDLVGIKTRADARGKGHATEVTSALTALGLETAPRVTLTVLKNNAAALALYGKLGFEAREDRIWLDNGADSSPEL